MNAFSFLDLFRVLFRKVLSLTWRMEIRARRIFFVFACNGPATLFAKNIIKYFNWQPVLLKNVNSFVTESVTLAAASSSTVAAPGFNGESASISINTFPPLKAHVLRKGGRLTVTAYSPALLLEDNLLLPSHLLHDWGRVKTDSGGLFNLEDNFCVGRINATTEIEEGILIGGAGAFNWYHFVIEVLPKAFLSKYLPAQFDGLPFLVPDECRKFPSFSSALAHFSDGRQLHFIRKGELASLQRLIVFDEITIGPFNLTPGEWPRTEDYSQHDVILRSFIAEFRSKVLNPNAFTAAPGSPERRIFLTRPPVRRRYNQEELLEIALQYGFEPFSPEEHTLNEQAKIFSDASAVVGPSGAAWVGMVFREKPLRGLTWLPREYEYFCGYSALANLLGHQLDFIESRTRRALKSTGEAYTTGYRVCPIRFESALKRMTGRNQ